jgi:phosphoribosylformylglycinamidine synthase
MKTAIIIFPGSNCDNEMERFLHKYTGVKPIRVWHKETQLPDVDLYVLPGGFSYGDYLRAGALANLSPIVKELKKTDRKILGICNGFQILCEAGLLPGTNKQNAKIYM